ncbi:hypothetical protein LCGC14_2232130 [marine sediment metagenome]|uniref:Uncharacterized protein n=1 Tax=marine sediment metagenome TaxID=412755 RepID=A0A0F9G387_9ZZZZ
MSNYTFTVLEGRFISQFLNEFQKVVNWKEYGPAEWYSVYESPFKSTCEPKMIKIQGSQLKILRMMIKTGLFVPEIETDKEYKVQRALGNVIGRIYYMPKEIREELKDEIIDV